ncbi:uncharacterized protein LOC143527049 [Brachyhypopomus gauderio]|uniref:uncharacterized protein LOC143527049 n=1 Tax=Brachyhypopomus gauderio TaxID=698409 RepID=UPI0040416E1C
MESWVLEGGSYSFLRNAPHDFSLRHQDGPNRVEIFDITSIPSSRSAISETTCLCDIFGDDCESPLSCSPASTSVLKRDVDEHLPSDDVNDSSGSYHTAHGSEAPSDLSDTPEDPNSPETDLILSNDKTEFPSPIPTNVDNNDSSQTENQQESHLSLDTTPGHKVENTDSSAQQQIMSMSEFRDTNIRVTDSRLESTNHDLLSENRSIAEEIATSTHQLREVSAQFKQQDCTFSEKQEHTVTSESSEKSLEDFLKEKDLEVAISETSFEDNVVECLGEKDEKLLPEVGSACSTPTENLSFIQETVKRDCCADLTNFSPEDSDTTSIQRCLSTPNCSITAVTPDIRGISSSPVHMDMPFETHATMEPKEALICSSSELIRLQSTSQTDDKAGLPSVEDSYTAALPTLTTEDDTEMNLSRLPQTVPDSPESRDIEPSPDHRNLSVFSNMTERTEASNKVSEFISFSGSSVAGHAEPSIIIHSPVGYTISPSPDLGRKMYSPEFETLSSTPDITDDCTQTLTNSRGSVSSLDSKVCLTPESRSITSTPESRQNDLTPEFMPIAPSPALRSATCSPEIQTRSCSSLSQNPKSPQNEGVTYRIVSPQQKYLSQSSDADGIRYAENSTSSSSNVPTNENKNLSISPTSNLSSTLGSISRPSSVTVSIPRDSVSSPETRDQRSPDICSDQVPVQEPGIPLGQARTTLSTVINTTRDFPSCSPIDGDQFEDTEHKEFFKSCTPTVDKSKDGGPVALIEIQTRKDSESEPPDTNLTVLQRTESMERMNDDTDLISNELSNPLNSCHTSEAVVAEEMDSPDINDNCIAPGMLDGESVGREEQRGHTPVKCRESPNVFHSHSDGECERQPWNKGRSREKAVQDKLAERKGAENVGEGSYRGEQVELSLSARNRKGPVNHSPASLSRDPKSGIPARCYFESSLTTRQQQSLLRAQSSQIKDKRGSRRGQAAFQGNHKSAGHLPTHCNSETSSMGSEIDEEDNEVKWFTDVAFRSLSSPHGDYLDVYNSSHRSSTNVSQPSTVESPGAATWMSYADLRGSALHENNVSCHTSSFLPHGTLDPAKRFEMGSFECVDVAVESMEESRKGRRTVPKRQIQLKRRSANESQSAENADNVTNSPSMQRCSGGPLVRQHSTPAGTGEDLQEGETEIPPDRKMLQKSASLDETSTKTKMASTVIKSVLSKKMENPTKGSTESKSSSTSEDKKKQPEMLSVGASANTEKHILSSSLPSECSLSSEDSAGRYERSPRVQKKSCPPKVLPKPIFKANGIPAYSNPGAGPFWCNMPGMDPMTPIMADPFENKIPENILDKSKKGFNTNNVGEKKNNTHTANAIARNTNSDATQAARTLSKMSNRNKGNPVTAETPKQRESRRMFLSKTPEITLKSCNVQEKTFFPKVSLCPDLEMSRLPNCESQVEETHEDQMQLISDVENEDNNETNKPKPVVHKVRDVRKLVKNTYNLSFTAPNTTNVEGPVTQKQKEEIQPQNPHALQIECKAISRKDKQESGNKPTNLQEETNSANKSDIPQVQTEMEIDTNFTEKNIFLLPKTMLDTDQKPTKAFEINTTAVPDKCTSISKSYDHCEQSANLMMPPRPSSKETSGLVFLQNGVSVATQKPASPVLSDVKSSSHSVSMLLKEKGMQADIGLCDILNDGASATPVHINKIEVPLQTCASDGTSGESQPLRKEVEVLPCEQKASVDAALQTNQEVSLTRSSAEPKEQRLSPSATPEKQSQEETPSKEEDKKPTAQGTSVTKISALLATSSKAVVRSLPSNTKSHTLPVTTSKEIELPIQVRSISSDRPKPSVHPKLYKQQFAEMRSISSDVPKTDISPTLSNFKQQLPVKYDDKKNEIPATPTHQEHSAEDVYNTNTTNNTNTANTTHNTNTTNSSNTTSTNNTRRLAVSAVSLPLPLTTSVFVQKSTSSVATERPQESTTKLQQPSALNSSNQQQENLNVIEEHVSAASSCVSSHPVISVSSQAHTYAQSEMAASSKNQLHKDDFQFCASDDPPSYDERESFSPLLLSDLPPRRLNRYHPTSKHSSCCCTTSSHPLLGHIYPGSQNRTPPASQSPGQALSYPGGPPQAHVRPHQCRPDGQTLNYPSVSPKTMVPKAPAMIQPMHHSHVCPAPGAQSHSDEQQPPPTQHVDRRPAQLHSPQTGGAASGAPYHEHSRSPNIAALDSRFFNTDDIPPAFGHEYGGDGGSGGGGGVLYPESASGLGYGQGPRRVLLDPETGKYFYIEVPMQPLRKMLFDPEMGQYVEVLIPQQALSHSGMYPPTAAPYPSLHGPGLYTPQYLPYAVPPHPQSAPQPRHQEPSVHPSLHQTTMGFSNSASQTLKSETKSLPVLDQSYLESMYYIPTGMNASPNSPTSDCYHKRSPNMPPTGGRRA